MLRKKDKGADLGTVLLRCICTQIQSYAVACKNRRAVLPILGTDESLIGELLSMQKLMVLYPMPQSPEEFRKYYLVNHLPLAAQLPGLKKSRYSLDVEGFGGQAPYFCVWEGEFDSPADLDAALSSEIGRRVAADVPNYATRGAILIRCTPVESTK
jgi:uncharacterized protein (TIGR02118 family)